MTIDPRITQAVNEAIKEAQQPEALGQKIIAWFEAVKPGNADTSDREATARHLEILFKGTNVEKIDAEDSD